MRQYRAMFPRTALVTGAASGIGAALVALLKADGAEVQELDVVHGFDVSDPGAWDEVEAVELACLNAGVTTGATDITEVNEPAYRRILGANVDGVVYGVRRMAEVMEPGGAIVVTASLAGLVAAPQDPALHAHEARGRRLRAQRRAAAARARHPDQRRRARLRRHAAARRGWARALRRCRLSAAAVRTTSRVRSSAPPAASRPGTCGSCSPDAAPSRSASRTSPARAMRPGTPVGLPPS